MSQDECCLELERPYEVVSLVACAEKRAEVYVSVQAEARVVVYELAQVEVQDLDLHHELLAHQRVWADNLAKPERMVCTLDMPEVSAPKILVSSCLCPPYCPFVSNSLIS